MARALPHRDAPGRPRLKAALLALVVPLVVGGVGPLAASAQDLSSPNQPLAISAPDALVPSPCKLVVPADQAVLQPMKIRPEQVNLKNRLGCLSPADALYGPDGCPVRMCGKNDGVFQLPPP